MAKRLCVGGPLDGQWTEVVDGQRFFQAPDRSVLYTRRRFMPVGGRGHVEVYAPKDVTDNVGDFANKREVQAWLNERLRQAA